MESHEEQRMRWGRFVGSARLSEKERDLHCFRFALFHRLRGKRGDISARQSQLRPLSPLHKRRLGGNKEPLSVSATSAYVSLSYLLLAPDFSLPLSLKLIITSYESAVGNISTGSQFGLVRPVWEMDVSRCFCHNPGT